MSGLPMARSPACGTNARSLLRNSDHHALQSAAADCFRVRSAPLGRHIFPMPDACSYQRDNPERKPSAEPSRTTEQRSSPLRQSSRPEFLKRGKFPARFLPGPNIRIPSRACASKYKERQPSTTFAESCLALPNHSSIVAQRPGRSALCRAVPATILRRRSHGGRLRTILAASNRPANPPPEIEDGSAETHLQPPSQSRHSP